MSNDEKLPETENEQENPRSIRDQLKEWGFDLDAFEQRTGKVRGEAKEGYGEAMEKVRDSLSKAKVQISEVAKASKPASEELKAGFERAWSEIVAAVKRVEENVAENKPGDEPRTDDKA